MSPRKPDTLNLSFKQIGIELSLINILRKEGVVSTTSLAEKTQDQLLSIPRIGKRRLENLKKVLNSKGILTNF